MPRDGATQSPPQIVKLVSEASLQGLKGLTDLVSIGSGVPRLSRLDHSSGGHANPLVMLCRLGRIRCNQLIDLGL
jgi:hypothetical protein